MKDKMKRSMLQIYVKGSDKALPFYKEAFDAEVISSYPNENGTYCHAELDIYGQVFALAEATFDTPETGNVMQFCLHFGEGKENLVKKAYDVLKDNAEIIYPLGECDYSPLMVDLIDKYSVRWCIFV